MVYLIHLERKMSHAQHYIGYSKDLASLSRRIEHHKAGNGARFLKVAHDRGIGFSCVRIWDAGKSFEAELKRRKYAPLICPVCNSRAHNFALDYPEIAP